VIVSSRRLLVPTLFALISAVALTLGCGDDDSAGGSDTATGSELSSPPTSTPLANTGVDIELAPSLVTKYYDVEGGTTEAIFNHIERNGPTDGEGKRGSGLTSVVWGYEWQGGPETGQCSIRSMTIKAEMEVTLPRHVDPDSLSPEIRTNWDAYAASVAAHEQTHVDIYNQGAEEIRERMLDIGSKPTCDELEAEIKRVWAEQQARINNEQAKFHQMEFDRLAQQRAPIGEQIDANRAQINSLQDQIGALETDISRLKAEIDALIAGINEVDSQIKDVNESSESSADKQAKLVVLVQQRNALQSRHNAAVDEHNQALSTREPLAALRNQLIDETNVLVDEFNWTR
jgi:predicted secreted Zn-dependent protease